MSRPPSKRPNNTPLGPEAVAAYESTIGHHGNVVRAYSSSLVNVFALFNAGGFSAAMAILPTTLGGKIFEAHPLIYKAIMTLFAIGFVASSALMIFIFQYSLHKYWDYRNALLSNEAFKAIPPSGSHYKFAAWAWVCLSGTVIATFSAVGFSLALFYLL